MILETDITVRFRDLDAMGHVNNAVFFTYFEEGRKRFFTDGRTKANDFNFILARVECDYVSPVLLNHQPCLEMWVSDIGSKSFTFTYRLLEKTDPALIFARGLSVQVCFDYDSQRTVPVSPALERRLTDYLEPQR
jgi:acyl-CoA thioester hydrolase